ncbi:hypothetical protein ACFL5V_13615 [Fibrobacterota bacterium]
MHRLFYLFFGFLLFGFIHTEAAVAREYNALVYIKLLYPNASLKTYDHFFSSGEKEDVVQFVTQGVWAGFIPLSRTAIARVHDSILCIAFEIYIAKGKKKDLKNLITTEKFRTLDSTKKVLQMVTVSNSDMRFLAKPDSFPIEHDFHMGTGHMPDIINLTGMEVIDSSRGAMLLKYQKDHGHEFVQAFVVGKSGRFQIGPSWPHGNVGGHSRCEILVEFRDYRFKNGSLVAAQHSVCDQSCPRKCSEYNLVPGRHVMEVPMVSLKASDSRDVH